MEDTVQLTKVQYEFLRLMAFGADSNSYHLASEKAYFDLCRTIRFENTSTEMRKLLRERVARLIEKAINRDIADKDQSQLSYDRWHRAICEEIQQAYRQVGIEFYIGQSQKWMNMAMKYLCVLNNPATRAVYPYLHVPIDQYIYQAAEEELQIKPIPAAWSRIDDYESYYAYQMSIRAALIVSPIEWEFAAWARMADATRKVDR